MKAIMGRSKPSLAVVLLFSLSAFAAAIPLHHNPQQPLGASSPLAAVSPICTCADASIPHCASLSLGHGDNFCICLSGAFAICGGKVERERERGGLAVEEAFKVEAKNSKHDDTIEPFTPRFWYTLTATIVLVLIGGIFAGLTIGIMSLDTTNLEILRNSGTEQEQRYAAKIEPVRKHGHWVLTTLLLGNVVINETLPILFDSLVGGGIAAIIISTGLVVLFGEIIPNAICARNGLAVGAAFAPLVKMCMWIMAPLSWPIAKLLDALLGHEEGTIYARAQLKTLIRIHEVNQEGSNGSCGDLIHDEVGIISAVLDLKDKSAKQIMTPLDDVFMMEINQVIDVQMIKELISRGHSRIPVYQGDRSNLIAILLAKRLIGYNVEKAKRISDVPLTYLPIIDGETNLFDMLNFFQEGRSHMAAVAMRVDGSTEREDDGKAEREILGVITLEDVIEELIGEEIIDETDEYIDVHSKIPVKRAPITQKLAKLLVTNITRRSSSTSMPVVKTPGGTLGMGVGMNGVKPLRRGSNSGKHQHRMDAEALLTPLNPPRPDSAAAAAGGASGGAKGPNTPKSVVLDTDSPSTTTTTFGVEDSVVPDSVDYFSVPIDASTRDERLQDAGWTMTPMVPGDRHSRSVLVRKKSRGVMGTASAPSSIAGSSVAGDEREHVNGEDETIARKQGGEDETTPLLKTVGGTS